MNDTLANSYSKSTNASRIVDKTMFNIIQKYIATFDSQDLSTIHIAYLWRPNIREQLTQFAHEFNALTFASPTSTSRDLTQHQPLVVQHLSVYLYSTVYHIYMEMLQLIQFGPPQHRLSWRIIIKMANRPQGFYEGNEWWLRNHDI